jgi:hypothetical protein
MGFKGKVPESWLCVDCRINTAPGMLGRAALEWALEVAEAKGEKGVEHLFTAQSEVYTAQRGLGGSGDEA